MDSKFEIDKKGKIIYINSTPNESVRIQELYSYMKNIWRKEELRKERREKLEKLRNVN